MGWFWAEAAPVRMPPPHAMPINSSANPPPSCPMHQKGADAIKPPTKATPSACPYPGPDGTKSVNEKPSGSSFMSKMNPLNYMFSDLSQDRAPDQTIALELEREPSTIPRGTGDGNWEYPSPQQMYNALLRKGYHDTDPTAVTAMVSVHNFLNEGAWKEIRVWEGLFSQGLAEGWRMTQKGEKGYQEAAKSGEEPSLMRFQGRPTDLTPKATMWQVLGRIYPSKFESELPFDRHDWYVQRKIGNETKEIRYVIDYYSAPDDENGNPVFNLDVRPAVDSPTLAMERIIRASGDIWYKASGASIRETK